MDDTITIPNWKKYQHYHTRTPAWICNHLQLLHEDEYCDLTLADRGALHGLWMVAAQNRENVGKDVAHISCRRFVQALRIPRGHSHRILKRLSDAGFCEFSASEPLAYKEKEKDKEKTPPSPPSAVPAVSAASADVTAVWGEYQKLHPQAKLTTQRRTLIKRRLADHPADMLIAAIHGNHADPWCNGENPSGKKYHEFHRIIADADQIEKYAASPPTATGRVAATRRSSDWPSKLDTNQKE